MIGPGTGVRVYLACGVTEMRKGIAGLIVVMGFNLLLWVMPYVLLSQSTGFGPDESQAFAQVFFKAHVFGIFVWQLFYGAHLLALGLILLRTRLVPHLLGWGLFIGAFGYLIQGLVELTFTNVFALDIAIIGLLVIVTISELGFAVWLLVQGLRAPVRHPNPAPQIA